MRVFASGLWTQKAGNTEREYEDAFAPKHAIDGVCQRRFAVSDGATETLFSGLWAKQLVRAYCKGELEESTLADSFSRLQKRWWDIVRRKALPWYSEQKVSRGTFATLLGLTLNVESDKADHGTWTSIAVGDSCLVQMRGSNILHAFPMASSSAFNNTPVLLSSNPAANEEALRQLRTSGEEWEAGDTFYLMTDALAAWFFRTAEEDGHPWDVLRDLDSHKPFQPWVEELRENKMIRNDDVTLYRIELT